LNNNRNNRRRGRGNRNQGGQNQLNRIDSRSRGNAPQLLDKYKKLAQDAQHNGDRVQAEYYLQFADHYFRVIADNKARQDESRAKRSTEREANGEGPEEDDEERRGNSRQDRGRQERGNRGRRRDGGRDEVREGNRDDGAQEGEHASEGEPIDADDLVEKAPRKPRRKKSDDTEAKAPKTERKTARKPRKKASDDGIDVGVLPPAITSDADDGGEAEAAE